jgi:peroxin-6
MLKAVTRQAVLVDSKMQALNCDPDRTRDVSSAHFFEHYATDEDVAVEVTEQDFVDAQRELVPSVSAGELAHYERVRRSFEGHRDGVGVAGGMNGKGKGKGREVVGKGKGKGKAADEDDVMRNGGSRGRDVKGKGVASFQDGTASDDELY